MQVHADADARHGELADTGLQEGSREVARRPGMGLLEEAVGLVAVAEVGGGDDHVAHLLCQHAQTGCRGRTGGNIGLLREHAPVYLRRVAAEPLSHLGGLVGMCLCPCLLLCSPLCDDVVQLASPPVVEGFGLGEDRKGIFRVAAEIADGIRVGLATERCAVGLYAVLVAGAVGLQRTFPHDCVPDDERWMAVGLLRLFERLTNLVGVVAVDGQYVPAPRAVFHCGVLVHDILALGGELNLVGVVEHDEVVKTE